MRGVMLVLLAVSFVSAGVMHFVIEPTFTAMVPPFLPAPRVLVWISGIAEIALGIATLVPRLRPYAGWGLVALLIAVFPANVYMVFDDTPAIDAPRWALWARLPIQAVLVAWAIWATDAVKLVRR
ncbi:DoxX family protein [Sandaracinus amylolyticus]|uniref:DoxX family protein n=1 Tax=Sandaracinus amylolyticus TaxID=927083 RepID=UPI001F1A0275|nr:DoxX family protein [Sandaracinus amylolyticus]UJR86577.1 Hypothetical protein I5071_86780 [Sandaracinus amylolyticus]